MARFLGLSLLGLMLAPGWTVVVAQPPANRPPQFESAEVSPEREITFRLYAPAAESVALTSSDIPGGGRKAMEKDERGIWTAKLGPVPAGAYRYRFGVDGVDVIDPRNPATSESNMNSWSLVVVPGSEKFDVRDVPHGAVAEVTYRSETLDRPRRMHVYTPPGYAAGEESYPVFYLLHGATDGDDSWTSVGRAGFILDNLIASGEAKPMILVMPHGHTGDFSFGLPGGRSFEDQMKEFKEDFEQSVRPYVEEHYRVKTGREHRALAGLSMGGAQTLNIAFDSLADYAYVGVFSSGIFGIAGGRGGPSNAWEEAHRETLDDESLKEGLRLVWFATGKEDFLLETTKATVEMLKKHGFDVVYRETEGGHTWLNWRDYLVVFAPKLFRP